MGRGYTFLGRYDDAITIFEKALEINENYSLAYIGLSAVYNFTWRQQEGIDALKKALDIEPNNEIAYVSLAEAYRSIGQFKEAVSSLNKARSVNDDYGDVYAGFGDIYRCLNQTERAKENYQKAISVYRSQGLEALAKRCEDILKFVENSRVRIAVKPKNKVEGVIVEDGEDYLIVKTDLPDLSPLMEGKALLFNENYKVNKNDIMHLELAYKK